MRSRARAQRGPLAMRTRLVQPFASVLGDPMLRSGYALIVSATATQVLGVLYWIVAARTAPAGQADVRGWRAPAYVRPAAAGRMCAPGWVGGLAWRPGRRPPRMPGGQAAARPG